MEKPKMVENAMVCPKCDRLDNVALVCGATALMWCSCGNVYRLRLSNERLQSWKLLGKIDEAD